MPKMNWNKLKDIERCKTDACGGFMHCRDGTYDKDKSDCQECLDDSTKAIEEFNEII